MEHDVSCCIVWKDEIFSPEDMILFFRWKREDDLPQKRYMEI